MSTRADPGEPGVHCIEPVFDRTRVHTFQHDDYGLDDIPELFQLGSIDSDAAHRPCLILTPGQIRELKTMADAYSFDFDEGLIELCSDLYRFAAGQRSERFVFVEAE